MNELRCCNRGIFFQTLKSSVLVAAQGVGSCAAIGGGHERTTWQPQNTKPAGGDSMMAAGETPCKALSSEIKGH